MTHDTYITHDTWGTYMERCGTAASTGWVDARHALTRRWHVCAAVLRRRDDWESSAGPPMALH